MKLFLAPVGFWDPKKLLRCGNLWCHVISCDVIARHVMSCHVRSDNGPEKWMSHDVKSGYVMSHQVMWCHIRSCSAIWCHIESFDVTSGYMMSYYVISCVECHAVLLDVLCSSFMKRLVGNALTRSFFPEHRCGDLPQRHLCARLLLIR